MNAVAMVGWCVPRVWRVGCARGRKSVHPQDSRWWKGGDEQEGGSSQKRGDVVMMVETEKGGSEGKQEREEERRREGRKERGRGACVACCACVPGCVLGLAVCDFEPGCVRGKEEGDETREIETRFWKKERKWEGEGRRERGREREGACRRSLPSLPQSPLFHRPSPLLSSFHGGSSLPSRLTICRAWCEGQRKKKKKGWRDLRFLARSKPNPIQPNPPFPPSPSLPAPSCESLCPARLARLCLFVPPSLMITTTISPSPLYARARAKVQPQKEKKSSLRFISTSIHTRVGRWIG
ncbi:hypothetical protein IE53DRAFT_110235 [Violaceomyces palustris]|uniref:Uncharacterized protein n=1 Tax=Violaceomyces palustris TaxID=1673888 RepID=A0ACD0NWK3_9BASI|nr:hypothetical protein IE53DRAFT_110235 [Violaceomyces palustris]